jgi:hypothetical protein
MTWPTATRDSQVSNYRDVAKRLLTGVRSAHTELFSLMLAEKAHRIRGRYTDAYEKLDKAMRDAEEAMKTKGGT